MGFTAKILGRWRVLVVTFTSAEAYSLQLITQGREPQALEDISALLPKAGKTPLLVMACGYGVIVKDIGSAPDVMAKVMAPQSGFTWRADERTLTFVRTAQLEPFAALKPLAIVCGASAEAAEKIAAEYYVRNVRLRRALKPADEGSTLASLLARRVQLPVLCALLVLLAANAVVGPRVQSRRQTLQAERAALQKQIGTQDDASRGRAQAVAEWGRVLPHRFGWLCDRAGAALPDGVTLTSLSVQPLLKNIEEGRKPQLSEGEMVVAGRTPRSESVSEFAATLGERVAARRVRLSSVEFDREKGVYNFRINLEL